MAKELLVSTTSGLTVYALGRVPGGPNIGKWANVDDDTLDDYAGADLGKYAIENPKGGGIHPGVLRQFLPFMDAVIDAKSEKPSDAQTKTGGE